MKKPLKLICSLALTATMAFALVGCGAKPENSGTDTSTPKESATVNDADKLLNIGVIQLVEHDALDSARNGFIDSLAQAGYKDGEKITLDIQNAQNDPSNLKTISQKFSNEKKDLVLAIATSSAQSMATENAEIPILGTAITDYEEAGLTASKNVSGTSDRTPVTQQFDLMMKLLPDTKTVGIMYNSSEVNSEFQAKLAQEAASVLGLSYEFGTVTSTNDIQQAVQSLAGKVDVLYIPTDNTFASAMATVSSVTNETKTPVIVGENGMCKGGGLATVGIDYYKLGQQTGQMAVQVLEGGDISTMPVEFLENTDICINLDTANLLGITIAQDIIDSATIVIENGEAVTK